MTSPAHSPSSNPVAATPEAGSGRYLLALGALFLGLCLLSWFTLDPLKYVYVSHSRSGLPVSQFVWVALRSLGPGDYAILVVCAGLGCYVLAAELRGRRVSQAVRRSDRTGLWVLLLALFVWFGHSLLTPGDLVGGDYSSHVSRIAHFRYALSDGDLALWNNYYYTGASFLHFTGVFYFVFGGLLDWLIQDPNLTSKVILFATHVASGVCFFFCLRVHAVGNFGAALGAIAYVGSLSHIHQVLWSGAHPQAITYVLMPLVFLLMMQLLSSEGKRVTGTWLALTLVNALLLYHHQSMAKAVGSLMIIHAVVYLLTHRDRFRVLLPLIGSAVASVMIAVAAVVPIVLERDWVMLYQDLAPFSWQVPGASFFTDQLLWDLLPTGKTAYLGASGLVVMLAGFTWAARDRFKRVHSLWLVGSLLLCITVSTFDRGQHVRYVVTILFCYAFLIGLAADYLRNTLGSESLVIYMLTVLVVIDLSSTAMQPVNRTDKGYLHEAGLYLQNRQSAGRVLQTNTWGPGGELVAQIGPGSGIVSYYKNEGVIGAHNLAATRAHNYIGSIIKMVQADLRAGELSPRTVDLLGLLNVHTLFNDTGTQMGMPQGVTTNASNDELGRYIDLGTYPSAIFAPEVVVEEASEFEKPAFWNEDFDKSSPATEGMNRALHTLADEMEYRRDTGLASRLVVRRSPAAAAPDSSGSDEPVHQAVEVVSHEVGMARASLVVNVASSGYVRIPHQWYPTLKVTLNGADVESVPSAMHFAVVPVAAGVNRIELQYGFSDVQMRCALFSAVSLFIVLLFSLIRGFTAKRPALVSSLSTQA